MGQGRVLQLLEGSQERNQINNAANITEIQKEGWSKGREQRV